MAEFFASRESDATVISPSGVICTSVFFGVIFPAIMDNSAWVKASLFQRGPNAFIIAGETSKSFAIVIVELRVGLIFVSG
jgi:hypothetical protein